VLRDLQSVLFVCTLNTVRSPMAAALAQRWLGPRVYVRSAGVRASPEVDGFAVAVMAERGLDIAAHVPRTLEELGDTGFDLIVTLSPEAHHQALEFVRMDAVDVEYWPVPDPTELDGAREVRLTAYRTVADLLEHRLHGRFPTASVPTP
jgi:protein-tyrosine-phosphatase